MMPKKKQIILYALCIDILERESHAKKITLALIYSNKIVASTCRWFETTPENKFMNQILESF